MDNPARSRAWILAAALVVVLGIVVVLLRSDGADRTASAAEGPDPFVLGFLPSQRADEIVPDAERLAEFLSERMGRRVRVMVPATYEPLIEGFRFGHVHAAFLDGGPAWIAHRRTGAQAILAEQTAGSTYYWAEAFVRADDPIASISEVPGKRLAFTSRTGSSGFLMPIGSFIADGLLRPKGDELTDLEEALRETFASTVDAGGYQQALDAVLTGRADVAFGAHDAPERFLTPEQRAQLRTLHRFGRIPSHAVVVSSDLPPAVVEEFRQTMLALNDEANLTLLRAIYGVDGLEPTTTEEHLGDFGRAISALPGMERTLVERSGS